jgi:hypothetical protein
LHRTINIDNVQNITIWNDANCEHKSRIAGNDEKKKGEISK